VDGSRTSFTEWKPADFDIGLADARTVLLAPAFSFEGTIGFTTPVERARLEFRFVVFDAIAYSC